MPERQNRGTNDHRTARPSRLKDWLATAPALLLVAAVIIVGPAQAAVPTLSVTGSATPGAVLGVTGAGFGAATGYQLLWDGSASQMPAVTSSNDGAFSTSFRIRSRTTAGSHVLAAAINQHASHGKGVQIVARVTVVVQPTGAPPTASPTSTPTAQATPDRKTASPSPTAPPPSATPTATPPAGDPNPLTCAGYKEKRIFLEVQSWWEGTNTPMGMAHLHAGTCFPLGQTVTGVVRFDTRIIMHNNSGHLYSLSTDLFTNGFGTGTNVYVPLDIHCMEMNCTYWVTTYVDTRGADDGWHEFRFKPRIEFPDGRKQMTSTGWVVFTKNGNTPGSSRESAGKVIGRGWYDGEGYQNPDIRNMSVLLNGPVGGTWSVPVRLDKGADAFTPTFVGAYIDPAFHDDNPGIILKELNGPWSGTLSINTTTLANGPHRLVLRVQCTHNGETSAGIMVYPFVVAN